VVDCQCSSLRPADHRTLLSALAFLQSPAPTTSCCVDESYKASGTLMWRSWPYIGSLVEIEGTDQEGPGWDKSGRIKTKAERTARPFCRTRRLRMEVRLLDLVYDLLHRDRSCEYTSQFLSSSTTVYFVLPSRVPSCYRAESAGEPLGLSSLAGPAHDHRRPSCGNSGPSAMAPS
jgi:hypothetical protein